MAECLRQTQCSKQMGQCEKNDLSPNVLVFIRGVVEVRVSDVDRNCLAG